MSFISCKLYLYFQQVTLAAEVPALASCLQGTRSRSEIDVCAAFHAYISLPELFRHEDALLHPGGSCSQYRTAFVPHPGRATPPDTCGCQRLCACIAPDLLAFSPSGEAQCTLRFHMQAMTSAAYPARHLDRSSGVTHRPFPAPWRGPVRHAGMHLFICTTACCTESVSL